MSSERNNQYKRSKQDYLTSIYNNKCPRCREGKLFVSQHAYAVKNMTKMHDHCPVCGQPIEIEVGFYYGAGYVSYALTIAFSVATFIAWQKNLSMVNELHPAFIEHNKEYPHLNGKPFADPFSPYANHFSAQQQKFDP